MKPYYQDGMVTIYHADNRDVLPSLSDIDSCVTDPPYGLAFMGKDWDKLTEHQRPSAGGVYPKNRNVDGYRYSECDGFAMQEWHYNWAKQVVDALKPGAYLLSFGGSRTYHRMACAIEDAGFEIRDQIMWVYGSGFPKSLDISKTISKKYNIGLCTCNNPKPCYNRIYEKADERDNYYGIGDNDGFSFSSKVGVKGTNNNEMASQVEDTNVQKHTVIPESSAMCDVQKGSCKEKQGIEKVGEPVLQPSLRKSLYENTGCRNTPIWSRLEGNTGSSTSKRQGMPNLRDEDADITSTSSNAISVRGQEHNGESDRTLPTMPQSGRTSNRETIIKNQSQNSNKREVIDSEYICPKCGNLLSDIGGTGLKPAHEPIVLARKPLVGTVAENVLQYGTGGLNIDECRIEYQNDYDKSQATPQGRCTANVAKGARPDVDDEVRAEFERPELKGRFPSNFIHDGSDEVLALFPQSKGQQGDVRGTEPSHTGDENTVCYGEYGRMRRDKRGDEGSAARFFYCAKASKSERDAGCEELYDIEATEMTGRKEGSAGLLRVRDDGSIGENAFAGKSARAKNNHPTVKPIDLMKYLIKLVTPPGGTVLDPFAGSGSTGVAARELGFRCILIEKDERSCEIAAKRCSQTMQLTLAQPNLSNSPAGVAPSTAT